MQLPICRVNSTVYVPEPDSTVAGAPADVTLGDVIASSSGVTDSGVVTKRRSRTDLGDMSTIWKSEPATFAVGSPTDVEKKPLIGILLNRSPRRRASFGVRYD